MLIGKILFCLKMRRDCFNTLQFFFVSLIEEVILLMWTPGLLNPGQIASVEVFNNTT
jgi:hypothetical protein